MTNPKFSILICTVGKLELTEYAVRSILEQTYTNSEVIVTDTSGGNEIRDMVASLGDSRVHFYEVPDLDPTMGWQYAYEKSTGDYVLWYDDDNCLVPTALQQFADTIEREGADIVSGNHVYYFGEGNRHDPEKQNALYALLPFSHSSTSYKTDDILRALYDLDIGTPRMPPRWHSAATVIARASCERAQAALGYVITPYMYANFTFHPVIFGFSKTAVYIDKPLCVIGKFSSSMTQQWSHTLMKVRRNTALPYRYTGVSQRTQGNSTAECYLVIRHDYPAHEKYPFAWSKFYSRYSSELLFMNIPLGRHLGAWHELWKATSRLSPAEKRSVRTQIAKQLVQSVVLHALRALGLWDFLRLRLRGALLPSSRRVTVNLSDYNITTILECARRLEELFQTVPTLSA